MNDNALNLHIGTSTLGADNRVLSSYLPDGTLIAREFRSVRTVVDDEGTIRQCTLFYPSGLPVQIFGTERVTDRAHIGNCWSNFAGLGWHDNTARWHDAILVRFTTPTPKPQTTPPSPHTPTAPPTPSASPTQPENVR